MVTHLLGKGAFGKVYLGELAGENEQYAIKSIRKDKLAAKPEVISNVFLECNVLVKANHPFLANMQYFFASEERLYFVMPFIGGGEMGKILKIEDTFKEPVIKFYVTQLVLGLKYLHESNLMHRDLKLENLMVGKDGYLRIVDFGLAKILRPGQVSHTIVGTPAYFAPEIL